MNNKISKVILVLLAFGCFLTISKGQNAKKLPEKQFQIGLTLSLTENSASVCNTNQIPLSIQLINSGKKPVVIDTLKVFRKIYIRGIKNIINSDNGSANGLQINSDFTFPHFQVQPSYRILKVGEIYETQTVLNLASSELRTADFLYIHTSYNSSDKETYQSIAVFEGFERSNEVFLDLQKCKP